MSLDPDHPFQADLVVDQLDYALYERIYLVLASTFVTLLVLTNIIGVKLFQAPFNPSFALTTAIVTYPLTFLVTDLVSEIYGKKRADFMVGLGFFMSLLMLGITQLATAMPPHAAWVPPGGYYEDVAGYQTAFESVFALNGVLLFASMFAYLSAQLIDNYLYHFWKRLTKGKHLWLRNNGSTLFSQAVDTVIVNTLFLYFGLGLESGLVVQIIITVYLYKLFIAAVDTPFIYLGVFLIKRALGVAFDEEVKA